MAKIRVILTKHAKERYIERFVKKHKPDLSNKEENAALSKKLHKVFSESNESKAHLCDTNLMCRMYEKYGYDRKFSFYVHPEKKTTFVIIHEPGNRNIAVTCY